MSRLVARRQRELNRWTERYLRGVGPLRVDGEVGYATRSRTMAVKWYLGYGQDRDAEWTGPFVRRLRHPHSRHHSSAAMLTTGVTRRKHQRRTNAPRPTSGVATFDGRPCAAWLVPYFLWARAHGWEGTLVSGWRDPAYSEHLCFQMCGAPACAGRCAGRSSNHAGSVKPKGAGDVSDYVNFGHVIAGCPYEPHIFNALPSDPVHFSATGR